MPFQLASLERMRLALRNPDFTTAKRIQDAINRMLGQGAAIATNPATVELVLPSRGAGDIVALLTVVVQRRLEDFQHDRVEQFRQVVADLEPGRAVLVLLEQLGAAVRIDVPQRRIDVVDADLATRPAARMAPRVTTGVLAKYARAVGSASRGAVTAPGPLAFAHTPRPADVDFDADPAPTDAATADALILV